MRVIKKRWSSGVVEKLIAIVEARGNLAEVNYARELIGKPPISEDEWFVADIAHMGG